MVSTFVSCGSVLVLLNRFNKVQVGNSVGKVKGFFLILTNVLITFFEEFSHFDNGQTPIASGIQKSIFLTNENYLPWHRTFPYSQDHDHFALCICHAFVLWSGFR